jgi:hypothetical protein
VALQKQYRKDKGYCVGTVISKELGIYLVVFHGEVLKYITPAKHSTAAYMSISPSKDGGYPLMRYDEFKPQLIKKAKEMQESE